MKWLTDEDTDEMTNEKRAKRAYSAALDYSSPDQRIENIVDFPEAPAGPEDGDEQMEEILSDMLCDLQHLANWYGVDWETVVDRGRGCNEEEVFEEAQAVDAMADGAPDDEGNETWETDGSEPMHQAMLETVANSNAGGSSGDTATIDNEGGKA